MSEAEILKGNKLIAEFLGYKEYNNGDARYNPAEWLTYPEQGIEYCQVKDLVFHSSWDWLMPVVEKIEEKFSASIDSAFEWDGEKYVPIYSMTINDSATRVTSAEGYYSKIDCVYNAVVFFIKWQKSQQL